MYINTKENEKAVSISSNSSGIATILEPNGLAIAFGEKSAAYAACASSAAFAFGNESMAKGVSGSMLIFYGRSDLGEPAVCHVTVDGEHIRENIWYQMIDGEVLPVPYDSCPDTLNTKIEYLYRDAGNWKAYNEEIVKGAITKKQINEIMECLEDGDQFIPSQVDLGEVKLEEEDTEDDTCWFELYENNFSITKQRPTVDLTVEELVENFKKRKHAWEL